MTQELPRSPDWQEPSTERGPPPREPKRETWVAVYDKETGELYSTGTYVAGKSTLESNGLAASKALGFNPQLPAEDGGAYEWDSQTRDFKIVSLAEGHRRSAAALRAEADRLDALAEAHDKAAGIA